MPRTKPKPPEPSGQSAELSPDRRARLGTKYTCFACGAKFYDLNKPEPICPKCKADQRERPAESSKPASPTPVPLPPPPPPPMASLLEDEEESAPSYDEDLELGLPSLDEEEEIFTEEPEVGEERRKSSPRNRRLGRRRPRTSGGRRAKPGCRRTSRIERGSKTQASVRAWIFSRAKP
jgi:hypothetical protein